MLRRACLCLVLLAVSACGGGGGGTTPTTPSAPAATRIIALSGNLAFGSVLVGNRQTASVTISNSGNATLTVTGITLTGGIGSVITASWTSGTIAAGGSQDVTLTFAPTATQDYSGILIVTADHTGGSNTISVSGTGTSPNRAPSITSMSFSPSFGIQQLTTFSYAASATDPDGDALTYTWDIAGNAATGASGTIILSSGGSGTATLTVSDGRGGTASDSRSVVVGSMTGTWKLTTTACAGWGNQTFTLVLTQASGTVTGTFTMPNGFCAAPNGSSGVTDPAEPGTIDASGRVNIRLKVGAFIDFYFRGTMESPGNRVTGGVFNSGFNGESTTLDRQ